MRKFLVNVNGTSYEVEVEEIIGGAAPAPKPVAAAPAPVAAPVAAPAPAPAAVPVSGGENVCAPMPGNILDVKVKVGDVVKEGQAVVVLEAMKMENDIPAVKNGTILSISVTKGSTVNSGDVLCVIG